MIYFIIKNEDESNTSIYYPLPLMESSDFYNITENESGQKVFSTARYLDAPLIADHLLPDMRKINIHPLDDSASRHLRRMVGISVDLINQPSLRESFDNRTLNVSKTFRAIAPSDIIHAANTIGPSKTHTLKATKCMDHMRQIITDVMHSRGMSVDLSEGVSDRSVNLFEMEESAIKPQSSLVSLRASGDTTLVVESFDTCISTHIVLSDMYCLWVDKETPCIIVSTYNMYLSFLDIVRVRARTSLAIDLNYSNINMYQRVHAQWKWQERWIDKYENEGFALAKTTEALNKTRLGWITDPETRVGGAYENMWIKIYEKLLKLESDPVVARREMIQARALYEDYVNDADEQSLVELFGLQKACGYPFIDSVRSGRSALKEAELHIETSYVDAYRLRNAFRALFITGYLAKEHKWPAMTFSIAGQSTALFRYYSARYTNLQVEDIDLDELSHVTFLKNFEFDMHENYLELMDDKALSYTREEADAYWNRCIVAKSDRRLLLEIMSRENFSYRAILEEILKDGVPHSWRIVCLYPKEKEMKADARMFAMMTLEMRTLFNGGEANLAKSLFPYISTQTMTKSKEEIHGMFREFTKPREDNDNQHLFLECDLSRWNLRWRGRTVNLVGSDLNNLFGVSTVYTLAHDFFSSSIIVVRTPRLRPNGIELHDPPAGPLIYKTWLGGVEGIQQKVWSLCTYAMIYTALYRRGLSYVLIGQGDNQILSIVAPRDDTRSLSKQYMDLNEDITKCLEDACAAVGQELKPEECLQSRSVITYSKEVWVNGVMRPLTLKYFSRVGARTNEEVPTLCSELAGLHASSVAAAEASYRPLQAYLGCCFLQVMEIERRVRERHPLWSNQTETHMKRLRSLTIGDHLKILSWPSTLGGLPLSTIWDYVHRGAADPLDQQIGVLFRLMRSSSYLAPLYAYYVSEKYLITPETTNQLLVSPYSLPLKEHPTARSGISSLIRQYIQSTAQNEDLKGLFSSEQFALHSSLLDDLATMNPMYPLIARELIDCSSGAEIDRLERMFIMTQTIQKAARSAGVSVSGIINMASGDEFMSRIIDVINTAELATPLSKDLSAFEGESERLRCRWNAVCSKIEGVTTRSSVWSNLIISTKPVDRSGVKVIGCLPSHSTCKSGPLKPYFGARTKVTRSSYGYKIVGDSRPARAVTRLRSFINMPGIGPQLQDLITDLARRRGFQDRSLSELSGGVSSSRFDHRYHARDDERGSHVVGPYNFSTHLLLYTEEIQGISGSVNDYPIMFQEYFTDLIGSLNACVGSEPVEIPYIEAVLLLSSEDVDILPTLATDIMTQASTAHPLLNTQSRLVYDPTIQRVDLVGTVVRKGLSLDIKVDQLSNRTLISVALRAMLLRSTPTHFTSTEIFDTMLRVNSSVKIDLAELIRIGGLEIVGAAVDVAVLAISERFLTEVHMGSGTGRLEVYVRRYSTFFSAQLINLWENVQTWDDPIVQKISGNCTSLLAGGVIQPVRRLQAILAIKIRSQLRSNRIPLTWQYVFCSEGGNVMSQLALGIIGKAFISASYRIAKWNEIVAELSCRDMYKILATANEGTRLRIISRISSRYRKISWLSTNARECFELMCYGQYFNVIDFDHVQALRLARKLSLPVKAHRNHSDQNILSCDFLETKTTAGLDYDLNIIQLFQNLGADSGWGLTIFRQDESYHLDSWMFMIQKTTQRHGVLFGVGHGYAARAMLESDFLSVVGVDIIEKYDLRSFRSRAAPFALRRSSHRKRFRWGSSMYENSTTENPQLILHQTIACLPEDTLIIFDIQPIPSLQQLQLYTSNLGYTYPLLFRWFSSYSQFLFDVREISMLFFEPKITCLHANGSVCLYVLTQCAALRPERFPRWSLLQSSERVVSYKPSMSIKGCEYLQSQFLENLSIEINHRLVTETDRRVALTLMRSMIGRRLMSDKYIHWTTILAHIKLLEWWIEDHCHISEIARVNQMTHTIIHTSTNTILSIEISSKLKQLFRHYAPNLYLYNQISSSM